jgi:hypothetical protein
VIRTPFRCDLVGLRADDRTGALIERVLERHNRGIVGRTREWLRRFPGARHPAQRTPVIGRTATEQAEVMPSRCSTPLLVRTKVLPPYPFPVALLVLLWRDAAPQMLAYRRVLALPVPPEWAVERLPGLAVQEEEVVVRELPRTMLRLVLQTAVPANRAAPVARRAGRRSVCRDRPDTRRRWRTAWRRTRTRLAGSTRTTQSRTCPAGCRRGRGLVATQQAAAIAANIPTTTASV